MYFYCLLCGLNVGVLVEFKGINVGEIKLIGIYYSKKCYEFVLFVMVMLYFMCFGMDICDDNL